MTNKPMLVINHIEPVGLIAESGSELAKAFSNTYFNQAANEIADQDEIEALHFMGSVAGHALCQMFGQNINIKELDSILAQIRSYVIQWHEAYKKIPKGFTSLQVRNLKKDYFKGDAFNTAFPLALIEMPQRWILDGVVEIEDGSEYEFSWRPDGILTFTDLIKNSGHAWSEKMQEAASAEYAVAIRCVARVL